MPFTSYIHLSIPDYRVLRYDLELNLNMIILDAALRHFPGSDPPGSPSNHPDIVLADGVTWLDTANNQLKMYYNSSWHVIHTFI